MAIRKGVTLGVAIDVLTLGVVGASVGARVGMHWTMGHTLYSLSSLTTW